MKIRTGIAAVATVALVTLAGCGSSSDDSDNATDGSSTTSSDTTSGDSSSDGDDGGDALTAANFQQATADAMAEAKSASMDMTMELADGGNLTLSGDIEQGDTPGESAVQMKFTGSAAGQDVDGDIILVDGAIYMNFGELSEDKYVKLDLSELSTVSPGIENMMNMSPTELIGTSKDALKSFKATDETKEIDGVTARKYDLTIDTTKVSSLMGSSGAAASMPAEVPAEVWIGDDDLIREMTADMGSQLGDMKMTMSGYGEDVDISAPPASEITDPGSLMGSAS